MTENSNTREQYRKAAAEWNTCKAILEENPKAAQLEEFRYRIINAQRALDYWTLVRAQTERP